MQSSQSQSVNMEQIAMKMVQDFTQREVISDKKKGESTYNIRLNRTQLIIIANVLENISRMLSGQVDTAIIDAFDHNNQVPALNENFDRSKVRDLADEIKTELYPELTSGGSFGVGSPKNPYNSKVMYEMYKIIRNFLFNETHTQQEADSTINVDKNPPLKYSEEPLITVSKS